MDDEKLFSDAEERPRLKVTDRRKFAADGTPRSSEPAAADPVAAEPAAADPVAADAGPTDADPASDHPADGATPATDTAHLEPDAPAPAAGAQENVAGTDMPPAAAAAEGEERSAAPEPSIAELPRDFSAFVEGMYLEAMLYLGALPDPRSGQVMEDIELARYKIDLLSMIEVKTQGNLSDDEKQQLEEVLYQLRTVYVETMKAGDS